MVHPFIMIDGYNLMHAVGLARQSYGPRDLEVSRNRLLQQLVARLNPAVTERTTVVFDAFGSDDNSHRQQVCQGITVIYAPAGTDADSEMERLVAAHSSPKQLLVVSGDHRLQRSAQRRKAKAIDSDVFWESLDPGAVPAQSPLDQPQTQQDTAFWLQEFADVEADSSGAAATDGDIFDSDYLGELESELDD